jgi:uncharacterized protein (TIGR01244 family)
MLATQWIGRENMQIKQITPKYFVSKLILPDLIPELAQAGFAKIICNLPDGEIEGGTRSDVIRDAAEDYSIDFEYIPITMTSLTKEVVNRHTAAVRGTRGGVLAYCATGRRSTILWALEFADKLPPDTIINRAQAIGYDIAALRSRLENPT